jgi:hypothetical protein
MSNRIKAWLFGGLTLGLIVLFLIVIGRPPQEIAAVLLVMAILSSAIGTLYYILNDIS